MIFTTCEVHQQQGFAFIVRIPQHNNNLEIYKSRDANNAQYKCTAYIVKSNLYVTTSNYIRKSSPETSVKYTPRYTHHEPIQFTYKRADFVSYRCLPIMIILPG